MKQSRNRLMAWFLTICMIIACCPITALATDSESHTHCVCGGSTDVGNHTEHTTTTTWTGVTSLSDITTAGYYYLKNNVTINATWQPANGVVLCLSGHSITKTGDPDSVIIVGSGVALTITDCKTGNEAGKITGGMGHSGNDLQWRWRRRVGE